MEVVYGVLKCSRLFGFLALLQAVCFCVCVCLCAHACVHIFVASLVLIQNTILVLRVV